MTMMLLDTTFLTYYWAGREAVKEYLEIHEDSCELVMTALSRVFTRFYTSRWGYVI